MSDGISYNYPQKPRRVYYTGKTINANASSRTAIATNLVAGMVLVREPDQHDISPKDGAAVTRVNAANLHQPAFVVTNVMSGSKRGGWIDVVPLDGEFYGQVYHNANITAGNMVALIADSFYLGAVSVFAATNQATLITHGARRAIAHETADTSGAAALKYCSGINT